MPGGHSKTKLTIAGVSVEVTHEVVALKSLRLDPENPRIRLQVKFSDRKRGPSADELMELMRAQAGYDALHRQIRNDGGIFDPLIVRHDGRIVEGNTRFAVMSKLFTTPGGAAKWGTVPIIRLPENILEKVVQLQMAGYHVSGKTSWRAAAQADQIYNLIEVSKASMEEVCGVTRMSLGKVQNYIEAYKFLIDEILPEVGVASVEEKQKILDSKFSHALEFVSKKKLKFVREDKEARKNVAKRIADGSLKGLDVRNLDRLFSNVGAREALEKKGINEAKEVLRKADPTGDSKMLQAVVRTSTLLENLDQKDLELFCTQPKACQALGELISAAESILAMATARGKIRA